MTLAIILMAISVSGSAFACIWAMCIAAKRSEECRKMPPLCEWPDYRRHILPPMRDRVPRKF